MNRLSVSSKVIVMLVVVATIGMASAAQSDVTRVNAITVDNSPNASTWVIQQTGPAEYQEFMLSNPSRLVVDFIGARHGLDKHRWDGDGRLVKAVRTSQFSTEPDEVTRVVFDLAAGAGYRVARRGNSVEISVFDKAKGSAPSAGEPAMKASFGSAWDPAAQDIQPKLESDNAASWNRPAEAVSTAARSVAPPSSEPAASAWTMGDEKSTTAETAAKGNTDAGKWTKPGETGVQWAGFASSVGDFGGAGGPSILSNKRITIDAQGADIKTVLRSVGEFSGANIVAGPDVKGPVTVHLVQVPWREALDILLKAHSYGLREEYGIFRIQTLDKINREELDVAQTQKQKEELEPLVSRVVKLNFTNANEMKSAMKNVTSKRGSVEYERDNNAVIINDIEKVADRIAEMVTGLDQRVKQVAIHAKMIDVDVEATREIGVQWDLLNFMSADVNGIGDAKVGIGSSEPFSTFRLGTVRNWGDVMATVEALERENKANIISNPRITTTDNKEASILVGKEIPLIVTDEAGNPITELKKIGITLRVTPHVNSDKTITMDLHPEISELSAQATVQGGVIISLMESDTRVLVRDGETAVIGGLINEVETEIANGLPVLKDIPVLGNLFKFESKTKKKREMIIFVTPRIVNVLADDAEMSQR